MPILSIGQTATLKGIILNVQNQPIQGANVTSGTNGTITNLNGFYSLKISSNIDVGIKVSHLNLSLIHISEPTRPY